MSLPKDAPFPVNLAQRPVGDLVDILIRLQLVESGRQAELEQLPGQFPEPRSLARELIRRGWLTPYQINQLFQDRGPQLRLGSYVLLERLGEGGMGQVFKARHHHLDRIVALKIIRKDRLTRADAVQRFHREIQAVAQLSHPNVVAAFDADRIGDTHFFAMEYVEGIDLGRLVKQQGPLAVDRACDYIRQAALGLQHAHEHGLVHRDIKPSNLLVTGNAEQGTGKHKDSGSPFPVPRSPIVKVLDLGLARLQRPGEEEITDTLTHEGTLMGTPDFIAPEQARNSHRIDARADLYSLGCTLYYLLAGRVPFPADTVTEKLYKQWLEEPSPIEQLRPEVPAGLAVAVRRLMAKLPEDRFQTAEALAAALLPDAVNQPPEAILVNGPSAPLDEPVAVPIPVAAAPELRKRFWVLAGSAGGALLVLAILGTILFSLGRRPTKPLAGKAVSASRSQTDEKLERLAARFGSRHEDEAKLRRDLVAFFLRHADQPAGRKAAEMAARLPSPLDELQSKNVPDLERWQGSPPQLLAVLGESRWRHWKPGRCAAFSPDGKFLAASGDDGIRLWDLKTGYAAFARDFGPVLALAFDGGEVLVAAGANGKVTFWDVRAGRMLRSVAGPGDRVRQAAFAPNGEQMAWGLADGTVVLCDRAAGKENGRLQGHQGPVLCLAFSADSKTLASGGSDRLVRIWDMASAAEVARLPGHKGRVHAVAFSPSGKVLASSGEDRTVRFWDVTSQKEMDPIEELDAPVTALRYVSEGKALAGGDTNGWVTLWNAKTGEERGSFRGQTGPVRGLAYSPRNHRLASVGADGLLRLLDTETTEVLNVPVGHVAPVRALAFSADGELLASGSADRTARLWKLPSLVTQAKLKGHAADVSSVAFSGDGWRLASGSWDGSVKVWELPKADNLETLPVRRGRVLSVAWSLDNKTLAAASGAAEPGPASGKPVEWGEITLWDTSPWRQRASVRQGDALAVALAPGGKLGASGGRDGTVKLWDWLSGRERSALRNGSSVQCVAFSPDGRSLAAGNRAGEIKLWNVASYQPARKEPLGGDGGPVSGLAFAPDGRTLASVSLAGGVVVWDWFSGKRLANWKLPGPAHAVAFAPDGRHIATANGNGTIYIFRWTPYQSRW